MVQAASTHIIQYFQLALSDLHIATLKSMNWVCFLLTFMLKENGKMWGQCYFIRVAFLSQKSRYWLYICIWLEGRYRCCRVKSLYYILLENCVGWSEPKLELSHPVHTVSKPWMGLSLRSTSCTSWQEPFSDMLEVKQWPNLGLSWPQTLAHACLPWHLSARGGAPWHSFR